MPAPVAAWHAVAAARDPAGLDALLADDVVFRSPAVHAPQEGRAAATTYLSAAIAVLGPTLRYRREWYAERSAVLEFEATLDGLTVHGIDLLAWGDDGRLVEFTVMARPFQGLTKLVELMAAQPQSTDLRRLSATIRGDGGVADAQRTPVRRSRRRLALAPDW